MEPQESKQQLSNFTLAWHRTSLVESLLLVWHPLTFLFNHLVISTEAQTAEAKHADAVKSLTQRTVDMLCATKRHPALWHCHKHRRHLWCMTLQKQSLSTCNTAPDTTAGESALSPGVTIVGSRLRQQWSEYRQRQSWLGTGAACWGCCVWLLCTATSAVGSPPTKSFLGLCWSFTIRCPALPCLSMPFHA